jgi:hypothetical protein
MRLLSVRDSDGKPVGFIFWRNLDQNEMSDWVKPAYQNAKSRKFVLALKFY